ncbi:hypothetical protein [Natrinema salaciae]|uniref:DUF8151 domain-containing protein n=1 Tax=Natrinema salaciae TaxID=1186196 RepID=A0A1H9IKY5_9EURY|nr:hypothetical protein [Natrinema salaciae]SEQ75045.1 hypothetical protein SAMN04489841_2259 [Natrinema salaciae]
MTSIGPELLAESLSLILYTVAAGVLTVVGVLAEQASLQHLGAGEAMIALWLAGLGGVMLYAGAYGIGYQKLLSQYV